MDNPITYRSMAPGEEEEVCALINRVFDEFIAPGYTPQGILEFRNYVQPEALLERCQTSSFVLVAMGRDKVVGMIELRDNNHLSLLFVDRQYQGRGISRELLHRALNLCRRARPDLTRLTVNSSPYAVPIYEKLGFEPVEPEKVVNGIRFIPMVLRLSG
ncbi:MAG: GNAT family N-acetyltransferase [Chloroflexota bacterium]